MIPNNKNVMKKFFFIFLLFLLTCHYAQAYSYDTGEKDSLRKFLRQSSALDGKLNLHRLGLSTADTLNWNVSEDWMKKIVGVSFYQDPKTKINYLSTVSWNYFNLKGTINWSNFLHLSKVDVYRNQLTSITFTQCPTLNYINCSNNILSSLTLNQCNGLQMLLCNYNQLTSLHLSSLSNLRHLYCPYNQLTTLNLSSCQSLEYLNCSSNQLVTLDVSASRMLDYLHCKNNKLTSLNLSSNSDLELLTCDGNQIRQLNLSNCSKITYLSCSDNLISELILPKSTSLYYLSCSNNLISTIDLTSTTLLDYLYCQDNVLQNINIGENKFQQYLSCKNNQLLFSQIAPMVARTGYLDYKTQSVVEGGNITYDQVIDLSAEYNLRNYITQYQWFDSNDKSITLKKVANGQFSVDKSYVGKTLICKMTNQGFSNLTIEYRIKIADKSLSSNVIPPVTLLSHLTIPEYYSMLSQGQSFSVYLSLSNNREGVNLGLYTSSGSFLADITMSKTSAYFQCQIPSRIGDGTYVIQPYVENADGSKTVVTRPAGTHFIDKLSISIGQVATSTQTRAVILTSETAQVSNNMKLTLNSKQYYAASKGETISVYIPAGQGTSSIGLFNLSSGSLVTDIVTKAYGDTYTCTIPTTVAEGVYIIMPYRKENNQIKIVERQAGKQIVDRLPLMVQSSAKAYHIDESGNDSNPIGVYLDRKANTLYAKGLREQATIDIFNLSGSLVKHQNIESGVGVDVHNLESGIYIVKLTTQSGLVSVSKVKK